MADYRAFKRSLFADLRGTVLEIGAGAGANFGLLPADVCWLGLEPSRRPRRRLIRSAVRGGAVLAGIGEQIPLQAGFAQVDMDWFTIPPRWSVYHPCIAGRAIALAWPLKVPGTACSYNQGDRHAAAHPGR
jgi:hypothetical protein